MNDQSGVDIARCNQDAYLFRISLKHLNFVIAVFQIFCIVIGILAFNRELTFELRDDVEWLVVWNGNMPTYCRNTTAPSYLPSLFKRFELEPYAKLGFKFALMYPATARIFLSYCKYHVFKRQTPKIYSKILSIITTLPPFLLTAQLLFCSSMLIISFQLDFLTFPFYNFKFTELFMISTGLYMLFCIITDICESSGIRNFFQSPLYLIRCLSAMIFIYSAVPTTQHLYTYFLPISCNHYADTVYLAVMEYLTACSIILFHFTELFDLKNVYIYVLEQECTKGSDDDCKH